MFLGKVEYSKAPCYFVSIEIGADTGGYELVFELVDSE